MIALAAQTHAQQGVCSGKLWIQLDRAAKVRGGSGKVTKLPVSDSQFRVQIGGRFRGRRLMQFTSRTGGVFPFKINAR